MRLVMGNGLSRVTRDAGRSVAIVAGLLLLFAAVSVQMAGVEAGDPPPDFADLVIADEIFSPISLGMAPDGRLIILTDAGIAHMVKNDQLLNTPVFDIRNRVDDDGDRGLQSMTFDNNFAANGYIYVVYTFDTNGVDDGVGRNRLVRFTMNGDVATNETLLFDGFPDADVALHYGGAVEMGADGKLYTTVGDYLIGANGQNRSNIKGTVLRLNPDGSIPTDNPFYDELTGDSRAIYAYGVRNPWQTAKNPVTQQIFFSDVGSNDYEELNVLQEGANYGWFEAEGPKDPNDPAQASFVDPLWAYRHVDNFPDAPLAGCAIIGGSFYETPNATFPAQYHGQYFTGDYCLGRINTVDPTTGQATFFMDGFDFGLVDMAVSPTNGDLYYIDQTFNGDEQFPRGGVGKITYIGEQTDITITTAPSDVSIAVGGDASFFVGVSAPGDVTYQWLRGGVPIPGENGPRLTVNNVTAADNFARFKVEISNGQQTIRSESAVLRITNNTVPVPTISFGGADGGYRAGQTITFSGSATDNEDGTIPSGDLRWEIRLNHDDHDHSLVNSVIGASGSFEVPPEIETSTNVWVTLYLTATDSDGTSTTVTQRIDPRIVTITLDSNPDGLQLTLDADSQAAPFTFDSVSGVVREISAPAQQNLGGTAYTFASWSDGLGRNAVRTTPNNDTTWTATYDGGGGGDTCTATAVAGGVRIDWTNKPGNEVVRNDGGWVTTPPAGTLSYTSNGGSVDDGWLVRRSGADEVCTVEGEPPPPPPAGDCVVTAVAGGAKVDWEPVTGENRYGVRRNGSWITTVQGSTEYTDTAGSVNDTYVIRYDLDDGNGKQSIACEGGVTPPPDDVCFVSPLNGGVRVTWQDKNGTEVVRNDDGWAASPPAGTLTYDDPNGSVDDGWLIRRTRGGGDEVCQIVN